jgi:hypothetical protein
MLRQFVCGLLALALVAGVALAAEGKKGKAVTGKFESYKDGVLKIKVGKKGEEPKTQEFKVGDDIKVVTFAGEDKKELAVKDAFTGVKDGTNVTVRLSDDDKVTGVQVGNPPKKAGDKSKTVTGVFASAKDGTLTIKVTAKKGEEAKAQEFKVGDDVKVVTLAGDDKKEGTAKDAFKDVKEGTPVTLKLGEGDKILGIQVGSAKKNK